MTFAGTIIADSTRAKALKEGPMAPMLYIPREDVQMEYLEPSTHSTHCPFKGDASYFNIQVGDRRVDQAVWSYEAPKEEVADVKDHLCFYESKVDAVTQS